jgi:hypothetical protein
VEREDKKAKFWLEPISLQASSGFAGPELRQIYRLIEQHRQLFSESWHDYFDD